MLIDDYCNTLPSKGSVICYKSNIKGYFKFLCSDTEHDKKFNKYLGIPLSPKQEKFIKSYFKKKRDYQKDVLSYHTSIMNSPAKTVKCKIASVKGFLSFYDVELPPKFWRLISNHTRGSRGVTMDRVPTREELKKILHFGTLKDRAFFLTLCSSGMRVGECCKIKITDLDLESNPAKIKVRAEYTKSGNPRIVYISEEAKHNLEQWLKERDRYIQVAVKRLNFSPVERLKKNSEDNRVFPFVTNVARLMWTRMIRKAGFDEKDPSSGWHNMHIHCLRKFFSSHMNVAGMPHDVVECLLGHEDGLKRIYNIYSDKQIEELYLKAVNVVTIFETQGTEEKINEMDEQLKEKEDRIQNLEHMLTEMKAQITELRLEKLEKLNGMKPLPS